MNERPTPETDQFKIKLKTACGEKYWVPVEHSERLERERDEAQRACQLAHDRLLRGDNDSEILDILAKGWRAAK